MGWGCQKKAMLEGIVSMMKIRRTGYKIQPHGGTNSWLPPHHRPPGGIEISFHIDIASDKLPVSGSLPI